MKLSNIFLAALFLSSAVFVSCKDAKKADEQALETEEITSADLPDQAEWDKALENMPEEKELSLPERLDALQNDIDYHWKTLMAAEREKDDMLKKLVREASYVEGVDAALVERLEEARKELLELRYDSNTMQVSTSMDAYDKKLSEVKQLVAQVKTQNPEITQYPIPNSVIEYFANLDNSDVLLRSNYGRAAQEYNELLMTEKDEIPTLEERFHKLKPVPVFEYGEI